MATILITGGTGLIGSYLSRFLKEKGYTVALLSRSGKHSEEFPVYFWDIDKQIIDPKAITSADYIIHLAGENIGAKRWTEERKKEIISSRILPTQLLFDAISKSIHKPSAFISASAIGYYGAVTSQHIFTETDPAANDFLGHTCRQWESEVDHFNELAIRTVKIRTGIALTSTGGALEKIKKPITLGLGAPLGTGNQYIPWIHIDDLCRIYLKAIEDVTMQGTYNAVAPEHTTNRQLMKAIALVLHKKIRIPRIPSSMLKLALGPMSEMLLTGSRVSSGKLMASGFQFLFANLQDALTNLFQKEVL
jgi:TIGR01777 family protein